MPPKQMTFANTSGFFHLSISKSNSILNLSSANSNCLGTSSSHSGTLVLVAPKNSRALSKVEHLNIKATKIPEETEKHETRQTNLNKGQYDFGRGNDIAKKVSSAAKLRDAGDVVCNDVFLSLVNKHCVPTPFAESSNLYASIDSSGMSEQGR